MPVFWECQRCTACCRWPGQVKISGTEIARMAVALGLAEPDFIQQLTRVRSDRKGLALEEKPDGACVLFENGSCRVQNAKPQQCLDYPNLWRHSGCKSEEPLCRARPVELNIRAYLQRLKEATRRDEITEGMLVAAGVCLIKDSGEEVPQ